MGARLVDVTKHLPHKVYCDAISEKKRQTRTKREELSPCEMKTEPGRTLTQYFLVSGMPVPNRRDFSYFE